MSLKNWWLDIKDLFARPLKPEPKEPQKRFVPPHSLPDTDLPPTWPDKDQRK